MKSKKNIDLTVKITMLKLLDLLYVLGLTVSFINTTRL